MIRRIRLAPPGAAHPCGNVGMRLVNNVISRVLSMDPLQQAQVGFYAGRAQAYGGVRFHLPCHEN